ncbi:MAG TPA: beta-eliminating lyase-related protein, partial [Rhodanobacter sp.]
RSVFGYPGFRGQQQAIVEHVAAGGDALVLMPTGGGWRQAGMLAAAGLHALDHHVARLADDHRRAAYLAGCLREIAGIGLLGQHTNMVFVDVPTDRLQALDAHLRAADIRISIGYLPTLRLVTHLDVDDEGIERVARAFRDFFGKT